MAAFAVPAIASGVNSFLGWLASRRAGRRIAGAASTAAGNVMSTAGTASRANEDATIRAITGVGGAVGTANEILGNALGPQLGGLEPYTGVGAQGASTLQQYLASNPQFAFNPQDLANEPGYQFQLQQGGQAVENAAGSRGLLQSGNTLQDLTRFGQGLAGTSYQNAFNRALSTFQTNRDTALVGGSTAAGIGLDASRMFNQAVQNTTNQQASNTIGSAVYGGNAGINMAQFLANLNMGAAETAGNYGMVGAGAQGTAGMLGAQSVGSGVSSFANILSNLLRRGATATGPNTTTIGFPWATAPATGPNTSTVGFPWATAQTIQ